MWRRTRATSHSLSWSYFVILFTLLHSPIQILFSHNFTKLVHTTFLTFFFSSFVMTSFSLRLTYLEEELHLVFLITFLLLLLNVHLVFGNHLHKVSD